MCVCSKRERERETLGWSERGADKTINVVVVSVSLVSVSQNKARVPLLLLHHACFPLIFHATERGKYRRSGGGLARRNGIQSQFKLESVNQTGKGARTHVRTYIEYKLRTCHPPPRRKLPFAVNLIRAFCCSRPTDRPTYSPRHRLLILTNGRNGCPVAFSALYLYTIYIYVILYTYTYTTLYLRGLSDVKKTKKKNKGWDRGDGGVGWPFCVYVVLCVARLHFRQRELLFKRHFRHVPALASYSKTYSNVMQHDFGNLQQIALRFSYVIV